MNSLGQYSISASLHIQRHIPSILLSFDDQGLTTNFVFGSLFFCPLFLLGNFLIGFTSIIRIVRLWHICPSQIVVATPRLAKRRARGPWMWYKVSFSTFGVSDSSTSVVNTCLIKIQLMVYTSTIEVDLLSVHYFSWPISTWSIAVLTSQSTFHTVQTQPT